MYLRGGPQIEDVMNKSSISKIMLKYWEYRCSCSLLIKAANSFSYNNHEEEDEVS
jgi:hypothetical protein